MWSLKYRDSTQLITAYEPLQMSNATMKIEWSDRLCRTGWARDGIEWWKMFAYETAASKR